jgi:hypothetical protein
MQLTTALTTKFILLAIALAYWGTAVAAIPLAVRESSLTARNAVYELEDLNSREIQVDDMELFVRDPLNLKKLFSANPRRPQDKNHPIGSGMFKQEEIGHWPVAKLKNEGLLKRILKQLRRKPRP